MAGGTGRTAKAGSARTIDRLRALCLALPEAHEQPFGGHTAPSFRVRGKIFAMTNDAGELWCKAPPGAQQVLAGSDPDRYFAPPYVGPKGWVGIRLAIKPVDWAMVEDIVRESFRLTAPKRLARALDDASR